MLNTCNSSEKMMVLSLLLHGFWHTSSVYTSIAWTRKIKIVMPYDAAWKLAFLIGSLSPARHTYRIGSSLSFFFLSALYLFVSLSPLFSQKFPQMHVRHHVSPTLPALVLQAVLWHEFYIVHLTLNDFHFEPETLSSSSVPLPLWECSLGAVRAGWLFPT